MIQAGLTYVPVDVADQFHDFIVRRDEQVLDAVKAKTRNYSTLSLLKLLYQLRGPPLTYTDLYTKSSIRQKRSFMNYLNLCVEYKFVKKESVDIYVFYSLTEKGRIMLNLFMEK